MTTTERPTRAKKATAAAEEVQVLDTAVIGPASPVVAVAPDGDEQISVQKGDSLAKRICLVMGALSKIEKRGLNAHHNYRFIEAATVVAAVRPKLAEAGVMILPQVHSVTPAGKNLLVQMTFTLVNADNPEDQMQIDWLAEGQDTQDKAINKATTTAMKFMLMRLFLLSDQDDPDSDAPDPRAGEGRVMGTNSPLTGAPTASAAVSGAGLKVQAQAPTRAPQQAAQGPGAGGGFTGQASAALGDLAEEQLCAAARAFLAEINAAEERATINDPKTGIAARIRGMASSLSAEERAALFAAINKKNDTLKG